MNLGPLMVDIEGTTLSDDDRRVLRHPLVGSVVLFSRNYQSPRQIAALTASIRALRSPPLLIAVDHEGGRVQRFREGFTLLPPVRALGRRYDADRRDALALAHKTGWLMAIELRAVGVDFSFAPCVDLDYGLSEVIGDRAFHRDADAVGALATAYAAGMREAGMAATAKHFPGHGAVRADSHGVLPADRRPLIDLEADLRPYRLLIENNLSGIMAAHIVYPDVDALPPSFSARWIQGVLRGDMNFHGVMFADDLTMGGAAGFGDVPARARLAYAAGCDVLPICHDRAAVHAVLDSFRPGGEDSTSHIRATSQARLVRMRARGEPPADLAETPVWQEARAAVAALSQAPPLVLTEEGPS